MSVQHAHSDLGDWLQVEDQKLKDYEGDYAEYLRKNKAEAAIMAQKEADQRERDKSNLKAKSKVRVLPAILAASKVAQSSSCWQAACHHYQEGCSYRLHLWLSTSDLLAPRSCNGLGSSRHQMHGCSACFKW